MTFGVNTSPFAGREGRFCTTRQLRKRLYKELETNLSLGVQDTDSPDTFLVKGRGELHLAILIETMRREGYEFEISKPEAITKVIDGKLVEPVELLTIDTTDEGSGEATVFTSLSIVQRNKFLSDDGRTFIFNTANVNQPWCSYYSFRGENGNWSEPKQILIDGKPQPVYAMNSTGSIIVVHEHILEWKINKYEVVRGFKTDYLEHIEFQITDNGKTLYMIATRKPTPDPRITDPKPRDHDLLQLHWEDDPKNPVVTKIATAHDITYRLLDNGQRLM